MSPFKSQTVPLANLTDGQIVNKYQIQADVSRLVEALYQIDAKVADQLKEAGAYTAFMRVLLNSPTPEEGLVYARPGSTPRFQGGFAPAGNIFGFGGETSIGILPHGSDEVLVISYNPHATGVYNNPSLTQMYTSVIDEFCALALTPVNPRGRGFL
jgi:hypothetical protein